MIDRAARLHEATLIVENGKPLARLVPAQAAGTTDDLLRAWPTLRHLTPEEAADFETDILAVREKLPALTSRWD
jgi:hypothetical protein